VRETRTLRVMWRGLETGPRRPSAPPRQLPTLPADDKTLTRDQLANPAVFAAATRNIPKYDPNYTFENTAHVRMARVKLIGVPLRKALHFLLSSWEDSPTISLIMERESLAAMIVAITIALFLAVVRISLRWYGEK